MTDQTLTIRFTRQLDGLVAVAVVERGRSAVLGRDPACDVRLDGRKVSRRHLRLENRSDGIIVVADAGSHNGTFVNGARVNDVGVSVSMGDLVVAGEWEGRVELRATPGFAGANVGTSTRPPNMMPAVAAAGGTAEAFDGLTDPNQRRFAALSVDTASRTNAQAQNRGPTGPSVSSTPPSMFATPPPQPAVTLTSVNGTPVVVAGKPAPLPSPLAQPVGGVGARPAPAPVAVPAPAPVPPQNPQTTRPTTMVLPMSMRIAEQQGRSLTPGKDWNWEDAAQTPETLRAARVEENPIVKRFAETSTQLDFRGLSDLPVGDQASQTTVGMKAPSAAVDAIALRLVFKVTEALQTTESMDDFLREMCDQLAQAARAKGIVVLLPDETGNLAPRVVKQRRPDEKMQLSRTVIDYVVKNRAALTTEDAAADERFARGESVLRFDLKAVLCVPLVRRSDGKAGIAESGGDVIGVLYLTRDLPFTNTERDLVAALAHLIAMGLERTRLREEYANAERTRRSLERFHAPDVVRRLMMESSAGVHRDGLFLEPLTATVLFCDLAGFTTYCEAHEPEQVGRLLNSYLGTMTETVFAHGGTVDKFIGDAVMCIFGAPFSSSDDALRGVKCAIEMRRNFRALVGSGACGEDARHLDVHIGVNTGTVVAGTVGSPRRMEYTALGDTVNTAARLEGVAKKGQIVVGPSTARLVGAHIPLRPMGAVSLKGKGAAVELFEVPEDGVAVA